MCGHVLSGRLSVYLRVRFFLRLYGVYTAHTHIPLARWFFCESMLIVYDVVHVVIVVVVVVVVGQQPFDRLPLIGNGDVFSFADYDRHMKEGGYDALMIVRLMCPVNFVVHVLVFWFLFLLSEYFVLLLGFLSQCSKTLDVSVKVSSHVLMFMIIGCNEPQPLLHHIPMHTYTRIARHTT
jgi:hypothetical protein